ncbi:MAG: hypothetical protein KGN34_05440 [Sphingomonadales bacterium]|nr:hypothetical protein [Sphingomonadales bacterium]
MAHSQPLLRSGTGRHTRPVILIWLALAIALLAFAWPQIHALRATDPDDYMRLLEVRDWLAGQGWADVRQYRMDPPHGADMHWSRLVDLPIAAILWAARLILPEPAASAVAMATVPLLQLLAAMLLLHRLMRALGAGDGTALTAAGIVLLFPMLTSNFMPMRIDHHGWQAICALGCMVALQHRYGPLVAGLIAGLWLTISLEGLLLALALAGIMALRWLRTRQNDLAPFSLALAASGTLLGLITRGPAGLGHATVDQLSWPQLLAFAVTGGLASCLPKMPGQERFGGRLLTLALIAAAGGAAILLGLGRAALDPFSGLDPVVRQVWLEQVREGMPIWRQDWSTRAMLVWTPLLVLAGWKHVRHADPARTAWGELALLALIAGALSLLLMRISLPAQLLTVPFAALLLAHWFPRAASRPTAPARIAGMAACLLLLTPSLASSGGKLIDQTLAVTATTVTSPRSALLTHGSCDLARLNTLPRSQLFSLLDLGPELLVRTPHSVVAGSYHRNSARMRDVIDAFSGDQARARAIVERNGARYLVFCPSDDEARIYAGRRPDGLAAELMAGQHPDWLIPQPSFTGGLQVFAVR